MCPKEEKEKDEDQSVDVKEETLEDIRKHRMLRRGDKKTKVVVK
jgi:hypothetical protein